MKKFLAMLLALVMVFAIAACATEGGNDADPNAKSEGSLTYAEYVAADLDSEVTIEAFVQAKQAYSAEYGNTSLYLQDGEGGYFVYRVALTQSEYDALTVGSKVKVTGIKSEWSGEVEITEATVSKLDGAYTASATDVTSLLGTDGLESKINQFVSFKGLTVEEIGDGQAFLYNWDGSGEEGSDLYFNVSYNGTTYNFTVESDLAGAGTEVYEAVKNLKVGDTVDLEGFLYWYNGANPHITSVTVK